MEGVAYAKFENYVYINTIHTYDMYMDELIREWVCLRLDGWIEWMDENLKRGVVLRFECTCRGWAVYNVCDV